MTSCRQLEVQSEDRSPQKWCVPLTEDTFESLMYKSNPTLHMVFGDGSLFSPLLFRKFFDPSDAFPLWEFESNILLSRLHSTSQSAVDWFQTDADYSLKAELPGVGKSSVQVCVENGKVLEISGEWKHQKVSKTKDWRSGQWWEHGYVRRLELPANADWRQLEAYVNNETVLEIRIRKKPSDSDNSQGSDGTTKVSESG